MSSLWKWIRAQLSQLTVVGLLFIAWSFIPDLEFWHKMLPVFQKVLAYSLTGWGRFILLLIGIVLIALEKLGLLRPKYDLTTLRGRTLQLRDDMERFIDKQGPMPEIHKGIGENDGDFLSRTLGATGKWEDTIMHTYELEFASRVRQAFHECGLTGIRHDGLRMLLGKFQTAQSFKEIIECLTWLSENVEN